MSKPRKRVSAAERERRSLQAQGRRRIRTVTIAPPEPVMPHPVCVRMFRAGSGIAVCDHCWPILMGHPANIRVA